MCFDVCGMHMCVTQETEIEYANSKRMCVNEGWNGIQLNEIIIEFNDENLVEKTTDNSNKKKE